ncbi:hypothetical protein HPB52_008058 [Rhipicephalus sanguineus]|uniref:Uncharacterized protein n=1 Tax=Rhipicephalus sanguineus TaxID=34632 RepID=A0A9D4SU03_RHISA|nr:hypothetical protein HPB52_008058 [Rhipicephalus sanguineus]
MSPLKALYRRCMLKWLVLTIDCSAPGTSGNADGPSDAPDLKISLLKAMRFIYGAWYEVRQTIIQNCFRRAGFVRQDQPPSPSDSETGTETADLTELWEHITTGALTSIDSLIDFMHIKGMPPEFSQQLEAMRTAVVKLKLPRKQRQISDYFGVPNP